MASRYGSYCCISEPSLTHDIDKAKPADKDKAHVRFQEIALAYAVLSDERRRTRYDNTGRTDDSLDIDDEIFNWGDFYRTQFADAINPAKIAEFTAEYKGSDEEKEALLAAYTKWKGSMTKVYQQVMVSNPADDDERFRQIINEAIESGDVDAFEKFTGETQKSIDARIDKSKVEGKEAEDYAKELGVHDQLFGSGKAKAKGKKGKQNGGDEDSLAALIQQRQKGREVNFLADLEAKYAAPKGKKGKKRALSPDEPPEEAFQATAKRATKGRAKK